MARVIPWPKPETIQIEVWIGKAAVLVEVRVDETFADVRKAALAETFGETYANAGASDWEIRAATFAVVDPPTLVGEARQSLGFRYSLHRIEREGA